VSAVRGLTQRRWVQHLLVLVAFALWSVVATWPLVAHLGDAVMGPPGDNYEYLYKVWWTKTALLDLHRSPFYAPDVFYPVGYDVTLSETTPANVLPAVPLAALWGEVVAYNLLMLASFALSAWAAYLLARELTGSLAGSVLAGLAFGFCAYRLAHMGAGHLPLMGTQWIPLAFLFVERALRTRRSGQAALVGLFYGLTGLSSWYYAYMVGLLLVPFALIRGWRARRDWRPRQAVVAVAAFVLVAGALLAPAAAPVVRNAGRGDTRYGNLAYVDQWSAGLADFVWPSAFQSLWGRGAAGSYFPNVFERQLSLGLIPLALAVVGVVRGRGNRQRAYLWLGVAALVLALGTTLHVTGESLRIPVPGGVERLFARGMTALTERLALNPVSFAGMRAEGSIVVPLPGLLADLFLPWYDAMRVASRFGLLVMLAVSVLAAGGVAALQGRLTKGGRVVGAVLIAGVAIELFSAPYALGYSEARPQPVDAFLAAQPAGSAVAQFPLDRTWFGYPLYETRFHRQPVAYGYGTFVPSEWKSAEEILREFPSAAALDWVRQEGVRYLVVAQGSLGSEWPVAKRALSADASLRLVGQFDDRPLFHDGGLMAMVPVDPAIPPSELVSGDKRAWMQDTIWVYEVVR
jgi:hypothetical protein